MAGIRVKEHEPFESAMKRFKRNVDKSGIMPEVKRREAHEKRSAARKRLKAAAKKRARKRLTRDTRFSDSARGGRRSSRGERAH